LQKFNKKKARKMINPVKALTNCLMSPDICENLETKVYNKKLIDEFLTFLHNFHQLVQNEVIKNNKEIKNFFIEL
jgi:hypothetical protein